MRWLVLILAVGCGGGARRTATAPPADEAAEVREALRAHVARDDGNLVIEGFVVAEAQVRNATRSQVLVRCEVRVTATERGTGRMLGVALTKASVMTPRDQILVARKECVIGAGEQGLAELEGSIRD